MIINTKAFKEYDFEDVFYLFNKVGFNGVELHLSHFLEGSWQLSKVKAMLLKYNLTAPIADGGWCDFATGDINSIPVQINLLKKLNIFNIRLFFSFGVEKIDNIIDNIRSIAISNPHINFLFETHSGVGLDYLSVKKIMRKVAQPNVGIVFDPVNLLIGAKDDINIMEKISWLHTYIKCIHVKGYKITNPQKTSHWGYELCPFGTGINIDNEVKLLIQTCPLSLVSIECESKEDPIVEMIKSKKHLESILK